MEYFSCLWKKISRIVIVVIALFCVGSIMPEEVKAYEGVDLRYKEEGKHNLYDSKSYTYLGYLRVYFLMKHKDMNREFICIYHFMIGL